MTKEKLTAQAWIEAAFQALTKGGPQAIRAEAIARDLNVSKGSFYWHFENVGALQTQMLSHWKDAATDSIISALEGNDLSSANKLRKLVGLATGDGNVPYGGALVEAAIRDWGRYNAEVAETVGAVDAGRLTYLRGLFAQCSKSETDAQRFAAILYGALIGLEQLSHGGLADLRDNLDALLETLLNGAP